MTHTLYPSQFPVFEPNQILSSSHLNKLREYLENEDRASRVKLTGTGIICGLNQDYMESTGNIILHAGYGVTTDGYLLEWPQDVLFTHFAEYKGHLPPSSEQKQSLKPEWISAEEATYLFKDPSEVPPGDVVFVEEVSAAAAKVLPVKEGIGTVYVLGDTDFRKDAVSLTGQTRFRPSDYVVVLYLEHVRRELRSCTGSNCDNKGTEHEYRLRVLLVPTKDVSKFNSPDPTSLPYITIPRVDRNEFVEVTNLNDFRDVYIKTLLDENVIKGMANAYGDLLKQIAYLPIPLDFPAGCKLQGPVALINLLRSFEKSNDIQYAADFMSDFCDAYNELVDLLYTVEYGCYVPSRYFPRHLVIDRLVSKPSDLNDVRSMFIAAKPVQQNDALPARIFDYVQRLSAMIVAVDPDKKTGRINTIRITPSDTSATIASRAIPFYYNQGMGFCDSYPVNLLSTWNPEATSRGRKQWRFGYNAIEWAKDFPAITTPFNFRVDPKWFMRVEGIHGSSVEMVLNQLDWLKQQYNINFNTRVVYLDKDLSIEEMEGYQEGLVCALSELKDRFVFEHSAILDRLDRKQVYFQQILDYINPKDKKGLELLKQKVEASLGKKTDASKEALPGDEIPKESDLMTYLIDALGAIIEAASELRKWLIGPGRRIETFTIEDFKDHYKPMHSAITEMLVRLPLLDQWSLLKSSKATEETEPLLDLFNFVLSGLSSFLRQYYDSAYYIPLLRVWWDLQIAKDRYDSKFEENHLFASFVKGHTGLEHLAGTWDGGTLLLVCASIDEELRVKTIPWDGSAPPEKEGKYSVVADFTISNALCCDNDCNPSEKVTYPHPPIVATDDIVFVIEGSTAIIYPQLNDNWTQNVGQVDINSLNKPAPGYGDIEKVEPAHRGDLPYFTFTSIKGQLGLTYFDYQVTGRYSTDQARVWIRVVKEKLLPANIHLESNETYVCYADFENVIVIDPSSENPADLTFDQDGVYYLDKLSAWVFNPYKMKTPTGSVQLELKNKTNGQVVARLYITVMAVPGFVVNNSDVYWEVIQQPSNDIINLVVPYVPNVFNGTIQGWSIAAGDAITSDSGNVLRIPQASLKFEEGSFTLQQHVAGPSSLGCAITIAEQEVTIPVLGVESASIINSPLHILPGQPSSVQVICSPSNMIGTLYVEYESNIINLNDQGNGTATGMFTLSPLHPSPVTVSLNLRSQLNSAVVLDMKPMIVDAPVVIAPTIKLETNQTFVCYADVDTKIIINPGTQNPAQLSFSQEGVTYDVPSGKWVLNPSKLTTTQSVVNLQLLKQGGGVVATLSVNILGFPAFTVNKFGVMWSFQQVGKVMNTFLIVPYQSDIRNGTLLNWSVQGAKGGIITPLDSTTLSIPLSMIDTNLTTVTIRQTVQPSGGGCPITFKDVAVPLPSNKLISATMVANPSVIVTGDPSTIQVTTVPTQQFDQLYVFWTKGFTSGILPLDNFGNADFRETAIGVYDITLRSAFNTKVVLASTTITVEKFFLVNTSPPIIPFNPISII